MQEKLTLHMKIRICSLQGLNKFNSINRPRHQITSFYIIDCIKNLNIFHEICQSPQYTEENLEKYQSPAVYDPHAVFYQSPPAQDPPHREL